VKGTTKETGGSRIQVEYGCTAFYATLFNTKVNETTPK
jgi:hypothetical protein